MAIWLRAQATDVAKGLPPIICNFSFYLPWEEIFQKQLLDNFFYRKIAVNIEIFRYYMIIG